MAHTVQMKILHAMQMYLMGLDPCCLQNSLPEDAWVERSTTWWLANSLLERCRSQHVGQKLSLHWAQKCEATFRSPPAAQMSHALLSLSSDLTKTCCKSSQSLVTLKSLGRDAILWSSGRGVRIRQVGQDIPCAVPPPLPFQLVKQCSQNVCWHWRTLGVLKASKHTMQRRKSSRRSAEFDMDSAILPAARPPNSFWEQMAVSTSSSRLPAATSPSEWTASHIAAIVSSTRGVGWW